MQIAVVGATGALGQEVLGALAEEANAPEWGGALEPPLVFASKASAGQAVPWGEDEELEVEVLGANNVQGISLAILATPEAASRDAAALLRARGVALVDASRAHRGQAPLWLAGTLPAESTLVSLPSAEGLMLGRTLAALSSLRPKWVRATVLKAASGAGEGGVVELAESTAKLLNGLEPDAPKLGHRLAFNVIPQAGAFTHGVSADEGALEQELRAYAGDGLGASTTIAFGPWFYGHFADVTMGLGERSSVEAVRQLFAKARGVKLLDDTQENVYPMPSLATGDESVLVGRLRPDPIDPTAFRFVLAMDNVRAVAVQGVEALKRLAALRQAH